MNKTILPSPLEVLWLESGGKWSESVPRRGLNFNISKRLTIVLGSDDLDRSDYIYFVGAVWPHDRWQKLLELLIPYCMIAYTNLITTNAWKAKKIAQSNMKLNHEDSRELCNRNKS